MHRLPCFVLSFSSTNCSPLRQLKRRLGHNMIAKLAAFSSALLYFRAVLKHVGCVWYLSSPASRSRNRSAWPRSRDEDGGPAMQRTAINTSAPSSGFWEERSLLQENVLRPQAVSAQRCSSRPPALVAPAIPSGDQHLNRTAKFLIPVSLGVHNSRQRS